jgi:hypothetical protein
MKTLLLFNLLLLSACDGSNRMGMSDYSAANDMSEMKMATTEVDASTQAATQSVSVSKKIIKNGNINFQSKSIADDYRRIQEFLPKFDAYIENENQSKGYDQLNYSLTLRVPAEQYDSLFSAIVKMAYKLENKNSSIQDVTAQYYDLEQRIANKKALEARYIDLLKQTTNIKDILEIERSLNEIRTEIEGMEGQFKYLSSQISLSTLSVYFYEIMPIAEDSYPRKSFGARVLNGLHGGWQGFLSFVVGLVTLWPFILIALTGIYTIRKVRSRLRK